MGIAIEIVAPPGQHEIRLRLRIVIEYDGVLHPDNGGGAGARVEQLGEPTDARRMPASDRAHLDDLPPSSPTRSSSWKIPASAIWWNSDTVNSHFAA